jgi:hypothetical protein
MYPYPPPIRDHQPRFPPPENRFPERVGGRGSLGLHLPQNGLHACTGVASWRYYMIARGESKAPGRWNWKHSPVIPPGGASS